MNALEAPRVASRTPVSAQPRVHLIGMGLVGSLIADLVLDMHGVSFSWEDSDDPICAWRASTGGVFPSGEDVDWFPYQRWVRSLEQAPGRTDLGPFAVAVRSRLGDFAERSNFWHLSKHPPHGAARKRVGIRGVVQATNGAKLYLSTHDSYHFNVQGYVEDVRERFALRRWTGNPPKGAEVIVTHGFTELCDHVVWGWSAKVAAELPPWLQDERRPCLYLRRGRVGDYMWPVPAADDNWYNVGSARVAQPLAGARSLDVWTKWLRWRDMLRRTIPEVTVGDPMQLREGWRPVARAHLPWLTFLDHRLMVKPMGGSGIRHWWHVYDALMSWLQLREVV